MFGIPLTAKLDDGLIKSTACRSTCSCPELLKYVSYALQKLLMIDITLNAEQRSAMEAIYNRQDVFVSRCAATYRLGKESVLLSPAFHHELQTWSSRDAKT